jgi:hypothetical protein
MRRLQRAFIAVAFAVLAGQAAAAEITRVASSGERTDPFDLDLTVRWERLQERATISREGANDELRYVRTRNQIVPRIAVGLWEDLELHAEMPYVFADDASWRFGNVNGQPSGGVPGSDSSIENNAITPDGTPCVSTPCPLFAVAPETTVYHGGRAGDLEIGLAWGIFNDRKDDTKPTWVVGMDVTFPTAERYDPAAGRNPTTVPWQSPFVLPADPGPFGEKVWKWDVYSVLSRRLGAIEPYVKGHWTGMFKSSSTYSNCDNAAALVAAGQMNSQAVANCATFGDEAGAKLPWVAGLMFGAELVPYEDRRESQRVALDLRLFADYTSPHRFYNELTDATGKLHQTDSYLTMGGLAGLYLRASEYISLQATASLSTRTAHYLTGESLGDPAAMNPNFDWRYDAPGTRFKIGEVSVFELGVAGVLMF